MTRVATEDYVDSHSGIQLNYDETVAAHASLLAQYKLDEASGLITSAGDPDGTTSAGVTRSLTSLVGGAGKAIAVPANADYVDFGSNYGFAGTVDFSVEVVFKPTALGGNMPIVSRHDGNNKGWLLHFDGSLLYFFRNASQISSAVKLAIGVKNHAVITYNGTAGRKRLYLNGALLNEGADAAAIVLPTSNTCRLGRNEAYNAAMKAQYDGLAFYSAELTPAEVADHAFRMGP